MVDNILTNSTDLISVLNEMDLTPTAIPQVEPTVVNEITAIPLVVTPNMTPIPTNTPVGDVESTEPTDDVNMDEYLSRFDKIQESSDNGRKLLVNLTESPHDQARIKALIEYAQHLQSHCDEMYGLLVDMNNVFGK